MQRENGRVTRNSTNEKELLTHAEGEGKVDEEQHERKAVIKRENGRVTRSSMKEKELLTFKHMQREKEQHE
jgi:hypothetical protein